MPGILLTLSPEAASQLGKVLDYYLYDPRNEKPDATIDYARTLRLTDSSVPASLATRSDAIKEELRSSGKTVSAANQQKKILNKMALALRISDLEAAVRNGSPGAEQLLLKAETIQQAIGTAAGQSLIIKGPHAILQSFIPPKLAALGDSLFPSTTTFLGGIVKSINNNAAFSVVEWFYAVKDGSFRKHSSPSDPDTTFLGRDGQFYTIPAAQWVDIDPEADFVIDARGDSIFFPSKYEARATAELKSLAATDPNLMAILGKDFPGIQPISTIHVFAEFDADLEGKKPKARFIDTQCKIALGSKELAFVKSVFLEDCDAQKALPDLYQASTKTLDANPSQTVVDGYNLKLDVRKLLRGPLAEHLAELTKVTPSAREDHLEELSRHVSSAERANELRKIIYAGLLNKSLLEHYAEFSNLTPKTREGHLAALAKLANSTVRIRELRLLNLLEKPVEDHFSLFIKLTPMAQQEHLAELDSRTNSSGRANELRQILAKRKSFFAPVKRLFGSAPTQGATSIFPTDISETDSASASSSSSSSPLSSSTSGALTSISLTENQAAELAAQKELITKFLEGPVTAHYEYVATLNHADRQAHILLLSTIDGSNSRQGELNEIGTLLSGINEFSENQPSSARAKQVADTIISLLIAKEGSYRTDGYTGTALFEKMTAYKGLVLLVMSDLRGVSKPDLEAAVRSNLETLSARPTTKTPTEAGRVGLRRMGIFPDPEISSVIRRTVDSRLRLNANTELSDDVIYEHSEDLTTTEYTLSDDENQNVGPASDATGTNSSPSNSSKKTTDDDDGDPTGTPPSPTHN